MAEEDDVDVLGDFNLDILSKNDSNIFDSSTLVSQNSDLLNCDYTIHPQWLLDKPSANPALWYTSNGSPELDIGKQFELETGEPHVSTANSITDESGWTEKEKDLLQRGIEIFGKSNVNLSQFVGSRTPAEVKYYLKNFYSDVKVSYGSLNEDGVFESCVEETIVSTEYMGSQDRYVLDDNEIPASIEEVIAAVSTAHPTVSHSKKVKKHERSAVHFEDIPSGQSLLKSSYTKKYKNENRAVQEKRPIKFTDKKSVKFKFKTKLKVPSPSRPLLMKKTFPKKKKVVRRRSTKSETESVKSEISDVQIVTGNGLAVPVCEGEEVIKIRKENETEDSESDIEIDVEDDENTVPSTLSNQHPLEVKKISNDVKVEPVQSAAREVADDKKIELNKSIQKKVPELEDMSEDVVKVLKSMEYPTEEVATDATIISELEKFVFHEYFDGRATKTPQRFMKIRNFILTTWNTIKPNYVNKTAVRNGLKQCGDVNSIGKIHSFLEQIGAINFGCEQVNYCRPLLELMTAPVAPKEKVSNGETAQKLDPISRQRNKKKYINDGEGGYTLMHDERGDIIKTTVVNEEPVIKQRSYMKKPSIRLIYCRPFSEGKKQEYTIHLDLSALILMDLHSHMYLSEVMGLIGGYWNSSKKLLSIKRYETCKNIAQSSTHCDMCPISQARASEILHNEDMDILGWFHSHPTFAPEPSQQDLDTQLSVQQWIGNNKPCIGFILSPFSLHGALIASPYRCLIVDKKENFEDQFVPYKFKVELVPNKMDVDELLRDAYCVMTSDCNLPGKSRVDFMKMYFQDNSITYLDKFIYSIKMHLAKCSNINKMTCDAIIEGLTNICTRHN